MCHRSDRLPEACGKYAGGVGPRPAAMLTQNTFMVHAVLTSGKQIEASGQTA